MGCGRFSLQSGRSAMEKYIHRENLTLFKKRLAESHSNAEREVLLKLLAEERLRQAIIEAQSAKPAREERVAPK